MERARLIEECESFERDLAAGDSSRCGEEKGSNEVNVASDGLPLLASDCCDLRPRDSFMRCEEDRLDDSWRRGGCPESSMVVKVCDVVVKEVTLSRATFKQGRQRIPH